MAISGGDGVMARLARDTSSALEYCTVGLGSWVLLVVDVDAPKEVSGTGVHHCCDCLCEESDWALSRCGSVVARPVNT